MVSLPLDPNDPARPRLILSCATPFDRYPTDPQRGRSTVVAAKDFRYVDIGAGLPEEG